MKKPGIAVLHKSRCFGVYAGLRRVAGRPFVYNYDISGWEAADELYKAAGAVLLLFGGVSLGRALCQKIEAGFAQTEGFIALLKYIRNQIDCYLMPVDKILAGCDPGILETCGVSADADLSVIHSFSELLDCCELCISEVLAELLRKFAGELGTSYRDTQLKICDYYIGKLTAERDRLQAELPARRKMIMTICISLLPALPLFDIV